MFTDLTSPDLILYGSKPLDSAEQKFTQNNPSSNKRNNNNGPTNNVIVLFIMDITGLESVHD